MFGGTCSALATVLVPRIYVKMTVRRTPFVGVICIHTSYANVSQKYVFERSGIQRKRFCMLKPLPRTVSHNAHMDQDDHFIARRNVETPLIEFMRRLDMMNRRNTTASNPFPTLTSFIKRPRARLFSNASLILPHLPHSHPSPRQSSAVPNLSQVP